jgi:uncharacterized protein
MVKASAANVNPALSPDAPERPWYKQPWVWFVIALPFSSVMTGSFLLYTAVKNADDLVADDWYREGRGTNRSMAAENLAAEFGVGVTALSRDSKQTVLNFHANREMVWPQEMVLALRHRTFADQDQEFVLQHQGNGEYVARSQLPAGNWHVRIASEDVGWRLAGPTAISANGDMILGAPQ